MHRQKLKVERNTGNIFKFQISLPLKFQLAIRTRLEIPGFFRAQEPKAPVTYCDHALSGVCRPSSVRMSSVVRPSVRRPLENLHFQLLLQNRLTDLIKLGMDEVLKVPYKCCCFSARSAQGRIQGGAKIGHGGPPLQRTSSSDRKATETNKMHSSDLKTCGKKCCYFWFHSEVNF